MFFGLCLMQNAPTQSLLSVVNGILDESIERKNGEIPQVFWSLAIKIILWFTAWESFWQKLTNDQRVACLLRKVVQEIERRISTQAEHLRTVWFLFYWRICFQFVQKKKRRRICFQFLVLLSIYFFCSGAAKQYFQNSRGEVPVKDQRPRSLSIRKW